MLLFLKIYLTSKNERIFRHKLTFMRTLLFGFLFFVILSFQSSESLIESGRASYYSSKFEGKKTASGEKFSQKKMTAAHKTLPFGTSVFIRNKSNDSTAIVKINDRLSKSSKNCIDVSLQVAKQLNFVRNGYAQVELRLAK